MFRCNRARAFVFPLKNLASASYFAVLTLAARSSFHVPFRALRTFQGHFRALPCQNSARAKQLPLHFFISFSLVFLRKNGKTRAGGAPQWGQSGWPPKNTNIRRPLKQPNWVAPFVHWVCHTRMHSTHVREYLCESVADASTKRPFSALTVVFALMHALDTRQGVSLRIGTTRPRNDPSPHLQSF